MKTAVISGGAGGLGRALSSALQGQGWHVFVLDRDVAKLEACEGLTAIKCDLTDAEQLKTACGHILEQAPKIDLAVYNAGVTQIGAFSSNDDASHRRVFEINYFAAVNMARHLLHAVRAANGTHLAISSVAGFTPLYHRTSYAASKHALEGFFKSLRSEENAYGVTTQIAAPSFVATNIGQPERQDSGIARPGSATDGMDYMTPEVAAQEILQGLERKRPMIPVGRIARAAWWINSISPRLYQHLMERKVDGSETA